MRWLDYGVIVTYLIGITLFGYRFRNSQKSLKDYFLGGRNAPWWAIGFSIVSAETSTLTVIGTPALSFNGNFGFLQVVFGYLLARFIISGLFLPQYFRGELFTAYELMLRRFGPNIRKLTAGAFLGLRALAEGVRVFAISIVVSIVLGTGEFVSELFIVCLTKQHWSIRLGFDRLVSGRLLKTRLNDPSQSLPLWNVSSMTAPTPKSRAAAFLRRLLVEQFQVIGTVRSFDCETS